MQRLYPLPSTEVPLDQVYRDLGWPEPPPDRPFVALNMVTTVDGAAALDHQAQPIGSATDHRLMRCIRANADAVMIGAGTLRAESVDPSVPAAFEVERVQRGLQPQPLAIVVSASAELPLQRSFFRSPRFQRVVLTGPEAPEDRLRRLRPLAQVVVAGTGAFDLAAGLRRLRQQLGVRWLLAEGGPTLNAALLAAELLDELFWTVAPRLAGGQAPTMVAGPLLPAERQPRLILRSVHLQDSELYLRYQVGSAHHAPPAE